MYQSGDAYTHILLGVTTVPSKPSSRDGRQGGSPDREQEKVNVGERNVETQDQEPNQKCSREAKQNVADAPAAAVSRDLARGPAG
jgi:hypothetical protein